MPLKRWVGNLFPEEPLLPRLFGVHPRATIPWWPFLQVLLLLVLVFTQGRTALDGILELCARARGRAVEYETTVVFTVFVGIWHFCIQVLLFWLRMDFRRIQEFTEQVKYVPAHAEIKRRVVTAPGASWYLTLAALANLVSIFVIVSIYEDPVSAMIGMLCYGTTLLITLIGALMLVSYRLTDRRRAIPANVLLCMLLGFNVYFGLMFL